MDALTHVSVGMMGDFMFIISLYLELINKRFEMQGELFQSFRIFQNIHAVV